MRGVEAKPLRRNIIVLRIISGNRPLIELVRNCRDLRQWITGKSAVWRKYHDRHNEVRDSRSEASIAGKHPVVGSPLNQRDGPAARSPGRPVRNERTVGLKMGHHTGIDPRGFPGKVVAEAAKRLRSVLHQGKCLGTCWSN